MRTATPEQKQKAQERRARMVELSKQVAAMDPTERAQIAADMPVTNLEGHALSVTNNVLIAYQRQSVTIVAGFHQWLKSGRAVRKGESGLAVWIPRTAGKSDENEPAEVNGFFLGTVFDVSQTEPIAQ
jgi:hypothetical protein